MLNYTDKKLPGVGISIGLTRLFYKLNELNLIKAKQKIITLIMFLIQNLQRKKSEQETNSREMNGIYHLWQK